MFLCCRKWSPRVFGTRARKRMSLRVLELLRVVGLLRAFQFCERSFQDTLVFRATLLRVPASEERKKERDKERKKERKRETRIRILCIHGTEYFLSISLEFFYPIFWRLHTHIDTPKRERGRRRRRPSCVPRRAALRRSSGASEVSAVVEEAEARDASFLIDARASRKRFDACRARRGGKEGSRLRF